MAAPKELNKKQAASHKTTARLMAEARRLFASQGYADTSAQQIVAAAGVTRGALYHHFDGKLGLFRAVVEQVQAEINQRVHRQVLAQTDPLDQLIAGNDEFLAACLDPAARRILLVDAPAVLGWDQWRAIDEANVLGAYKRTLRQMMDAGVLRPLPADALAHIISGAANEAAIWAAQTDDPQTALRQAQQTMAQLIRTLRA